MLIEGYSFDKEISWIRIYTFSARKMFRWIIFLLTVASLTQGRTFALLKTFLHYVIFAVHKMRQLVYMLNVHKRRLVLKCLKKIWVLFVNLWTLRVANYWDNIITLKKLRNYYKNLHNLKEFFLKHRIISFHKESNDETLASLRIFTHTFNHWKWTH